MLLVCGLPARATSLGIDLKKSARNWSRSIDLLDGGLWQIKTTKEQCKERSHWSFMAIYLMFISAAKEIN